MDHNLYNLWLAYLKTASHGNHARMHPLALTLTPLMIFCFSIISTSVHIQPQESENSAGKRASKCAETDTQEIDTQETGSQEIDTPETQQLLW
jgi:hypothetical protein